ncbi:MAG TPA: FliA/WhiG family RNA polymerase sigma factor [Acidobacteriaceae bacterium]|nr:FliA/WhiG family RNA polymerase sigma factor [Acidobacteriaceae bacterium]
MATSPGSNVAQASLQISLGVLPALEWMPLPSPKKQSRGTAAKSTAGAKAERDRERERVLLEHMPLVRMVAYRILERLPQSIESADLVSAGVVGLIDAYNKFNPKKQVLFRSYAAVRIHGAILDSLRGMDWAPREIRRKAREMEEATQRLTQRMGRKPQQSEVAAEMGMAFASFEQLRVTMKGLEIGSLQEPHGEGSGEETVYLEADPEDGPLHRYMRRERAERLSAVVAELPEREQRVLQMYYVEEMTLKEIGLVLGLVESRVSQIRTMVIEGLRARIGCERSWQQT